MFKGIQKRLKALHKIDSKDGKESGYVSFEMNVTGNTFHCGKYRVYTPTLSHNEFPSLKEINNWLDDVIANPEKFYRSKEKEIAQQIQKIADSKKSIADAECKIRKLKEQQKWFTSQFIKYAE